MEFDFVYADLKVQVIFKADNTDVFGQLNDGETILLQQMLYNMLTVFSMVRGFYVLDKTDTEHGTEIISTEGNDNG